MTHVSRSMRPAALAAALLLASTVAIAGPGRGPGMHGPAGGPPASGEMVEQILATMKDKLALDTTQQVMFDNARAQSLAAREKMHANRTGIRAKVETELAKTEPDLAAIASALDAVEEQARAARRQARDEWLKLYATLRPDQKAVVRDAIKVRLDRAETMRGRMQERMRERSPRAPS